MVLCHLRPSLRPVQRNTDGIHEASSHGDNTVATQADCPQSIAEGSLAVGRLTESMYVFKSSFKDIEGVKSYAEGSG